MNTISSTRTLLNPNAREFVPIYLKSSSSAAVTVTGDETEPSTVLDIGKTFSDKTVSSDTCASDEESRRYWSTQLPDDILTPDTDFFTPAVDDTIEPGPRMSACESSARNDAIDYVANNPSRVSTALNGILQPGPVHVAAHDPMTGHNISRQLWDEEYTLSSVPLSSRTGDWNRQLSGGGNGLMHSSAFGQTPFKVSSTVHALNALSNEFPNIPEQTLAEVYQANGGDLGLTIRVIHQLKLQGEASLWHGMPSPARFSPNTRPLGFSTTSTPDFACRSSHFIEEFDGQHKE